VLGFRSTVKKAKTATVPEDSYGEAMGKAIVPVDNYRQIRQKNY
jgi:hypothetical protein